MPSKGILIDVEGGLVQEVFVTEIDDTKICLIDWDNIKEGDVESSPWSEWSPVLVTAEEFRKKLTEAETAHASCRICQHCGTARVKDGKIVHDESKCPTLVWNSNTVQFPQLLAMLGAVMPEAQKVRVAMRMGLAPEQVDELVERAKAEVAKMNEEYVHDASNTAT